MQEPKVRKIVEGLLEYKWDRALHCQAPHTSSGGTHYYNVKHGISKASIQEIKSFLEMSWFDEEFSYDACVTSSDLAQWRTNIRGLNSFCPEISGKLGADSVGHLLAALGPINHLGIVKGVQGYERRGGGSTRYMIHVSLDKEAVARVMDESSPSPTDMFTPSRERKGATVYAKFQTRTLWDIVKNPHNYELTPNGVYLRTAPEVRGKADKKVLNLAMALVAKDTISCLSMVLGRDMSLCIGTHEARMDLTPEEVVLVDSIGQGWRVKDRGAGSPYLIMDRTLSVPILNFTPTLPDKAGNRIAFYKMLTKFQREALAKAEEQSDILIGLYTEHGKGFSKWLAKELAEKVALSPLNYIHDPIYRQLAELVLGG